MSLRENERGFTLVEVLVSFAILTLSLGVLLSAFGTAAKLSSGSEDRARAMLHAESVVDSLKVGLWNEPVTMEGSFDDGFRWRADIVRSGTEEEQKAWIAAVYDVTVRVFWGREPSERRVELRAVRLVPKGFQ